MYRWLLILPIATSNQSTWFWCCAQLWTYSSNFGTSRQLLGLLAVFLNWDLTQLLHSRSDFNKILVIFWKQPALLLFYRPLRPRNSYLVLKAVVCKNWKSSIILIGWSNHGFASKSELFTLQTWHLKGEAKWLLLTIKHVCSWFEVKMYKTNEKECSNF